MAHMAPGKGWQIRRLRREGSSESALSVCDIQWHRVDGACACATKIIALI